MLLDVAWSGGLPDGRRQTRASTLHVAFLPAISNHFLPAISQNFPSRHFAPSVLLLTTLLVRRSSDRPRTTDVSTDVLSYLVVCTCN